MTPMASLDTLPPALRPLIEQFLADATGYMAALENGSLTIPAWRRVMAESLARYHTAALMVGQGSTELTPEVLRLLENTVDVQLSFLDNFARVMEATPADGQQWAMWTARAQMYAESPISSFAEGDMIKQTGRIWPVAAVPGQGTQCGGRCRCVLRYDVMDAERGDADIYWVLGVEDSSNCQTCQIRAQEWNPMRIRDGVLLP